MHLHRVWRVVKAALTGDRVLSEAPCSHTESAEGGTNPPVPSRDLEGQPHCVSAFRPHFCSPRTSYSVSVQFASRSVPPHAGVRGPSSWQGVQGSEPCGTRTVGRNRSRARGVEHFDKMADEILC